MRVRFFVYILLALFTVASCSKKNDSKITEFDSDDELIVAIQKAGKQEIDVKELPFQTQKVINSEFEDDYVEVAKFAPKLGYEINLMCEKGPFVGERSQAYFNLEGRKLETQKGDMGRKRIRCFEFVLPVTFTMPDGSEITIAEEEDWELIKDWYETHPDVNEKPALQFPVDLKFRGGTIKTIIDETGMQRVMKFCNDQVGDDKEKCFRFVYPVTFVYPDGTEIIINSWEVHQRMIKWHAEHPDARKPELVFPVNIFFFDSDEIITLNNLEELKDAKESCD